MAEIRFDKLMKKFGDTIVVHDLDLTIHDGEFFTFVGPSGCGKSTLLNILAGIDVASSGTILFDDRAVNELAPRERDVAMVFQSYALYPHMTVFENIAFPLRMKKQEGVRVEAEVGRVAELLGLQDLLSRMPKELSGGQRQRVALGRAIVRRPRVFLMDEPLSNLDARLRVEMRTELKRLHQELRITTVYVTHDQAEAMSLSDRMAVLHAGRVQQLGPPHEAYIRPENLFVAGFIGTPPMNVIPCAVTGREPLEIECFGLRVAPATEHAFTGDRVFAGIRPEDLAVTAERPDPGAAITVSVLESAGPFLWVDAFWGEVSIKGRAPIEAGLRPGVRAYLSLPSDRILVFDPATGKRL